MAVDGNAGRTSRMAWAWPAARERIGWGGLGAIAGVIGVVVTIVVACTDGSSNNNQPPAPATTTTTTTAPVQQGDITQEGSCLIAGSSLDSGGGDITVRCDPPPKSLAGVSESYGSVFSALYAGSDASIPAPSDFDGYDGSSWCHNWTGWVKKAPDVYLVNPVISLDLESGLEELVVVKDVRVVIFDKVAIASVGRDPKVVNCQVGGGSNTGNIITVDTVKPQTTLMIGKRDDPGNYFDPIPMPPASLTSKGLEYESADIRIASEEGYYYRGRLEIVARKNGEEIIIPVGTTQQPLRWVSDGADKYHPASVDRSFSWKSATNEWVDGHNIFVQ